MAEESTAIKTNVTFVLYQCQVWVNRPGLTNWLNKEIAAAKDTGDIFPDKTWREKYEAKIQAYQSVIEAIASLNPNTAEEMF